MDIRLDYDPQPRQVLMHKTPAQQILYGGAAGGGKSHALRWDAIAWCLQNPGCDAYLFRRTRGELQDNHIRRIQTEIPKELGVYNKNEDRFQFTNGSGINFCYCERENDVTRYQGAEIHWLGIDEASHLTQFQISYLRGRVRLGSWSPKQSGLPRIVFASNPGGPGHSFLKSIFIEKAPAEELFYDKSMADPKKDDEGWLSIYIPARMDDNEYLSDNYAGQFQSLPPEMARALTEGDWDAVVGAAVHNLSRERHQLRAFTPPRHWTRFMALDWGTAKPFSVGWYCVSDGALLAGKEGWPERYIPAGAVVRYREWYGVETNPRGEVQADKGIRMPASSVAQNVLRMEKEWQDVMDYRVGDSAMWAQHDGPSPQESMFTATNGRFLLIQSKKDRKAGYEEILSRLAGNEHFMEEGEEHEPMFFVTANCTHFWRTVPPLISDANDPDKGPDTKQEDHCLHPDTIVHTEIGGRKISDLRGARFVATPVGFREFIDLGVTNQSAETWTVRLADGQEVKATGNHPVLCADGEYRRVDELTYDDYIIVSTFLPETSSWHSTLTVKPIGSVGVTISDVVSAFIGLCGSIITGLSRKVSTFITSTAAAITTTYQTLLCCTPAGTLATTRATQNTSSMPNGIWKRECDQRPANGTAQRKVKGGILSRASAMRRFLRVFRLYVKNAGVRALPRLEIKDGVRRHVMREPFAVAILDMRKNTERSPVHNLHVPGINAFMVNGGAVVHNCYDECVYALRSRPYVTTAKDREDARWQEDYDRYVRKTEDPYATA